MKVLVTRPIEDGAKTAERLKKRGFDVVLAPVTAITATGQAPPSTPFDGVLISSANAIRHLSDDARMRLLHVPIYCVGEKTASVVRASGFTSVTTGTGDGRALVKLVASTLKPSAALLYLTGTPRKPFIEEGLSAHGFHTVVTELYRTIPVDPWPADARASVETCDKALHFSRASVEALLLATEKAGLSSTLRGLTHLCLSEDVAVPLRENDYSQILVAAMPSEEDVLSLLHIKET
ncbi:MAG: uroporphyrinogen-III synthase [Hyphomicrobiales bacterium]